MPIFGNYKLLADAQFQALPEYYQPVVELLAQISPTDDAEARDIAQIIQLMLERRDTQPTLFERACEHAHFTASAFVINPHTKQALLHKHKKFGNWLQFGGHADGERDLRVVALKEAEEESGLSDLVFLQELPFDISVHTISARDGIAEHLHLDIRYLLTTQTTEVPTPANSQESQDLAFFPLKYFENGGGGEQGPQRHDVQRMFGKVGVLSS